MLVIRSLVELGFQVYDDRASKYTYAPVLTDPSRTTPTFVRFSTVQGSKGSAVTTIHPHTHSHHQINAFLRILSVMFEALQPSSTLKRVTGTLLATIYLSSSYRMPSNSPTSFIRLNLSLTTRFLRARAPTTTSGTSWVSSLSVRPFHISFLRCQLEL